LPPECNVYVVDDDPPVRESLQMLLEVSGYAVATFESAKAFLADSRAAKHGCLIADVRMPEMTGLELQQELVRRHSPLRLVMISGHADIPLAVAAMKAGAIDFLEKPFRQNTLVAAVRRALGLSGETADSEAAAAEVRRRLDLLTPREREVFDAVVMGRQNKMIAHELGTSPRTVEIHRQRMMSKMRAANLQELVRMAVMVKAGR